jgi:hypothetical protein
MSKHKADQADPLAGTESEPGRHMAEFDMRYQVGVTFCDGNSLKHIHTNPNDATTEYGEMLAEALAPTAGAPEARHVRLVSFFVVDEWDHVRRHIDSGVFPCKHRGEK